MLENRQNMDDDRIGGLEVSLREAQTNATEADKKYEEVSPTAKFHLYLTFLAVCLSRKCYRLLFSFCFLSSF